jgi:hypothetical protein
MVNAVHLPQQKQEWSDQSKTAWKRNSPNVRTENQN